MMENSNTGTEAENTQTTMAVESPDVSQKPSEETIKKAELTGLLARARNVHNMLTDFKAACEGSTVSGHVAIRMAIGLQWLDSMLRQNKSDIESLQDKLK